MLNSNDIKSEQMETFTEVSRSLHVSPKKKVVVISCVSLLEAYKLYTQQSLQTVTNRRSNIIFKFGKSQM